MQKLVSKLDELVAAAKDLRENSKKLREIDSSPDKYGELGDHRRSHARWLRHAKDVLIFGGLREQIADLEQFLNVFPENSNYMGAIGVLEGLRDTAASGFLGDAKFLVHTEVFGSLLEQADALLKAAHKVPAAVLVRVALERWIRDQASILRSPLG